MTTRLKRVRPIERASKHTPSKDRLRVWLRLLRMTRSIEAELRARLRIRYATTLPRFDVLSTLHRREQGMTMTALSRQLIVSNGNVTGIVDRLVADGLVMRRTDAEDRRATFVVLTREGSRRFAEMSTEHEAWIGELLEGLGPDDAVALIALLERTSGWTRTRTRTT